MSAAEIATLLSETEITPAHIRRAVHHLTKSERLILYDEGNSLHRSVSGKFFEALVYELLITASEDAVFVTSVVAKMSDALFMPFDKYAPDGLWYSRDGGIRFKVGGRVAAEMDLLVQTSDGVRIFGEVIINSADARGFRGEVAAKKQLLSKLYGDPIEFLLVLPAMPPAGGLRCLSAGDAFVVIPNGETLYSAVHPGEVMKRKLSPSPSTKRVSGMVW